MGTPVKKTPETTTPEKVTPEKTTVATRKTKEQKLKGKDQKLKGKRDQKKKGEKSQEMVDPHPKGPEWHWYCLSDDCGEAQEFKFGWMCPSCGRWLERVPTPGMGSADIP